MRSHTAHDRSSPSLALSNYSTITEDDVCLDASGKGSSLDLVVPFLNPSVRAHRGEHLLEVLARLVVLAAHLLATMEVQIRLVAVARLVGVGVAWIERSGLDRGFGNFGNGGHCNEMDALKLREIYIYIYIKRC